MRCAQIRIQRLDHTKRDRHRYRKRTKMLMKKYVVVRKKKRESWGLQKTELQDLQLGVVMQA